MAQQGLYSDLQRPTQDQYEVVGKRPNAEAGEETTRSSSGAPIHIALGIVVCVLLVVVIAMGAVWGHKCRQPGGNVHLEPRPGDPEQPPVDKDQERERCADPTEKEPELLNDLRRFLCMDPVTGTTGEVCEICPSSWHRGPNGTCYFVSSEGKSWDFSYNACSVLGAHLAVIQDREELEMLREVTVTGFRYWIGLSSNGSARWRWLDGTQLLTNVW
ncbi:C-type lectin domain family 1 member A-like isoform X2 [Lepisosteus oculatus]|uniref:C-type lectin domain family 1 member A-like isoform X2 n=1 Tax=Lepisosteus oculatus TaxID=7918 RepID=UPI0035F5174E